MCCERRGLVRAIGAGRRRHGRLGNAAFATGVRRRRLLRERGRVGRAAPSIRCVVNAAVRYEPSAPADAAADAWKTGVRDRGDGDGFCENAAASDGGGALE